MIGFATHATAWTNICTRRSTACWMDFARELKIMAATYGTLLVLFWLGAVWIHRHHLSRYWLIPLVVTALVTIGLFAAYRIRKCGRRGI